MKPLSIKYIISVFSFITFILPGLNAQFISCGYESSFTLCNDASVLACGTNINGQQGNDTADFLAHRYSQNVFGPGGIGYLDSIIAISSLDNFTLALKEDGTVWGWGQNTRGNLGDSTVTPYKATPVKVKDLTNVIAISAGDLHSMALKSNGTVWTWGKNAVGALGDGTLIDKIIPIQIPGLSNIIAISAGGDHSLALQSNGRIWAWGANWDGMLGDSTTTYKTSPVQVYVLTNAIAISAGLFHSMALTSDGEVWTWGDNVGGQLGDSTLIDRLIPTKVPGISDAIAISASFGLNSFVLVSDGTIWSWGTNTFGQLGDSSAIDRFYPGKVVGLDSVISIGSGDRHSVALRSNGTVWAWGRNNYGQLGDSTGSLRNYPVQRKLSCNSIQYYTEFNYATSNLVADFTDLSLNADSWRWDFGDGNTSSAQDPSHTYAASGTYTVCLTASYRDAIMTVCKDVTVDCAVATPGFGYLATDLIVTFSDSSVNAKTWMWDFGDGQSSVSQNPAHTYDSSGTYTVCLTITDSCGVADSICKILDITTGIFDLEHPSIGQLVIFPNPVKDEAIIRIPFKISKNTHFTMINSLGKVIYESKVSNLLNDQLFKISTSQIPVGIYFIKVNVEDRGIYIGKFVKME